VSLFSTNIKSVCSKCWEGVATTEYKVRLYQQVQLSLEQLHELGVCPPVSVVPCYWHILYLTASTGHAVNNWVQGMFICILFNIMTLIHSQSSGKKDKNSGSSGSGSGDGSGSGGSSSKNGGSGKGKGKGKPDEDTVNREHVVKHNNQSLFTYANTPHKTRPLVQVALSQPPLSM
jgi:hypothetical protein